MANKVVICGIDTSSLPKCTNEKSNELLTKIKQGVPGAQEEFVMLGSLLYYDFFPHSAWIFWNLR